MGSRDERWEEAKQIAKQLYPDESKPEAKSDHQHKFVKADVGMQSNLGTPVRYECSCGKARIELEEDQPTKSDIREQLERWDFINWNNIDLELAVESIEALVAQERREARIDELKGVMRETETGDASIWVHKWAKKRLAELEATDKGAA